MSGNTILILGGAGFIGTALSKALQSAGNEVLVLSRTPSKGFGSSNHQIVGNFDSPADFVPFLPRCRTVVHLASRSTPGSSAGRPLNELEYDLRVTLALLEALQNAPNCELLFVSSGGTLYDDKTATPATESSLICPLSYHGAAKAAAEQFISAWARQFCRSATILRPSNVFGPGQTARQGFGIIPTTFEKILKKEALEIWGDGNTVRDYLYIDDLIRLFQLILAKRMCSGTQIINAGTGTGTSLNELLSLIESITDSQILKTLRAKRQVDASRIIIDPGKALSQFGWKPQTTLIDGLQRTWDWWITQK